MKVAGLVIMDADEMFLTPLSRRPSSCQDGTVVLLAKAKSMLYATVKCPPPGKKSREGVIR